MQIYRAFEGQFRDGFESTINRSITSVGCPSVACGLRREREGYRANAEPQSKHFYSTNRGPDTRVGFCARPPEILACAAPVFRRLG